MVVFGHLRGLHPFCVHAVKGVNSSFLLDAESAARVTPRPQVLLYHFADRDVFHLYLMAKFHRRFGARCRVVPFGKVPLENGQRAFGLEGKDDIQRDMVGITIQHPVGEDPEVVGGQMIVGFRVAAWRGVSFLCSAHRPEKPLMMGVALHA